MATQELPEKARYGWLSLTACRAKTRTDTTPTIYIFTDDGSREDGDIIIGISGWEKGQPETGVCYEMVVQYKDEDKYCQKHYCFKTFTIREFGIEAYRKIINQTD